MSFAALASREDTLSYGDTWERTRVAELHGRGVPWPHISKQVGRNEIDLRRLYGQALQPPPPPPPPEPEPTPAPVATRKPRSGKDPQAPPNQALVLLTRGDMTVPELAERMGWTGNVGKAVMGGLVRGGFAVQGERVGKFSKWRITDNGRAKLARMTVTGVRGRPSHSDSLPNTALALIKAGGVTNRKLAAHLKVRPNVAGWIIGDLHRRGFVEATGDASPRIWRITLAGLGKLARARPWP